MTRRKSAPFELQRMAHAALLMLAAAGTAQAQNPTPDNKLERVEVTGSSIKRLDGEAALPVEVIKREDIAKTGVTTAAELLQKITSNVGGLTDGASTSDVMGGQRGFNGANLRGLGTSSTLVLLNGRRLANFASPGDNAGVDLNSIPAGAIQRVEVLKDGASAIYGTDAMGGVINFITRKDYQGADLSAYVLGTQQGGAGKRSFSASAGTGDLARDRYNAFISLDLQKTDRLEATQRDFIKEYDLPGRLPPQTSSTTFPANVDLSTAQLAALNAFVLANPGTAIKGTNSNGTWNPGGPNSGARRVNFGRASCTGSDNPNSVVPDGFGGREGCSYDYMKGSELYPNSDKRSLLGRATFQIADDHQLFTEVLLAQANTDYAASPATVRFRVASGISLPASLQAVTGVTGPLDFRFRLEDAGRRTSRVESESSRFVAGAEGRFGSWDYTTALNYSSNKATDADLSGWVSFSKLEAGIRDGKYNPFVRATDSSAGRAFMESIRINDATRFSKGTSTSLDAKLTRSLATLEGGDLMLALGAELRREKVEFSATDALKANDVNGDRSSSGALLADDQHTRNVSGMFAELSAPFTKTLEGQLAIRHDSYGGVFDQRTGVTSPKTSTTNPKLGLSYRPSKQLLARASYGTGFRAPSVSELFLPVRSSSTNSYVRDPVSGEVAQMPIDRYSNPSLKPEKSKQASLGVVFEPSRNWNGSIDYWRIRKSDIISDIGEETIFTNPVYYNNPAIVVRDSDGVVENVIVTKENRGKLNTSGFDVSLAWRGEQTDWGRFGASVSGTLVTEYKFSTDPRSPLVDGLGRFRDDKAVQRWRHKLSMDWERGPLTLTLTNNYMAGYRDQNTPGLAAEAWNNRDVSAYSLWDLSGVYKLSPELRLRVGVLNLLDTAPPFTNQSRYFQVTWDPTYGDPRGRSFFASLNYSFR